MRQFRTKAVKALISKSGATNLSDAIVRTIAALRAAAQEKEVVVGLAKPPYDPTPLAFIAGAIAVRAADLGFDGRIVSENGGLIVEYDVAQTSLRRRRFTIAHEIGHLVLWQAAGAVTKLRDRKTPAGNEVEEVCNKIGAEILAPRNEIRDAWRSRGVLAGGATEFVLRISRDFDLSLNFSALRFREICAPHRGVALLNISDRSFEWAHHIDAKTHLLRGLIQSVLRDGKDRGAGSYSKSSPLGIELVPFEWRRFSEERALVFTGRS